MLPLIAVLGLIDNNSSSKTLKNNILTQFKCQDNPKDAQERIKMHIHCELREQDMKDSEDTIEKLISEIKKLNKNINNGKRNSNNINNCIDTFIGAVYISHRQPHYSTC